MNRTINTASRERLQRASLKAVMAKRRFALAEFLQIGIKIAESLGKLHQKNIIHKDIKPANLIWTSKTAEIEIRGFDEWITT